MELKHHAKVRSQQRGIPPIIVDLLIRFGHREKAGDGMSKVFMNKRGQKKIPKAQHDYDAQKGPDQVANGQGWTDGEVSGS